MEIAFRHVFANGFFTLVELAQLQTVGGPKDSALSKTWRDGFMLCADSGNMPHANDNSLVERVAPFCRRLISLDVSHCSESADAGLSAVAAICTRFS